MSIILYLTHISCPANNVLSIKPILFQVFLYFVTHGILFFLLQNSEILMPFHSTQCQQCKKVSVKKNT